MSIGELIDIKKKVIGRYVLFIHSDSPESSGLTTGDIGTITDVSTIAEGRIKLSVRWGKKNINFDLIQGIDKYDILPSWTK